MTFTLADPLSRGSNGASGIAWRCSQPEDAACEALYRQQQSGAKSSTGETAVRALCELGPERYAWLQPQATLGSEFNLVCHNAWKANFLETAFFCGFMLGNGVFGMLADRLGRRRIMLICCIMTALLTAASGSPLVAAGPGAAARGSGWALWLHAALRVLSGFFCAGEVLAAYVLATEFVGPRWRGAAGMLTQTAYILGEFLLVLLALRCATWRSLTLAGGLLAAAGLPLILLLPESPRWLLQHGRPKEALAALAWLARRNGSTLPPLECTEAGEVWVEGVPAWLLAPQCSGQEGEVALAVLPHNAMEGSGGNGAAGQVCSRELLPPPDPAAEQQLFTLRPCGSEGSNRSRDGSSKEPWPGPHGSCQGSSGLEPASPSPDTATPGTLAYYPAGPAHSSDSEERAPLCAPDATVPFNSIVDASGAGASGTAPATPAPEAGSLLLLLRHAATRRLFLTTLYIMFSLSVAYFGVTLALGTLSGSLELNFFLMALAELPAYLLIAALADRLGRCGVIAGGSALSGVACLLCGLVPQGVLQVVLAMAGKFGCSSAWALGITYASELFPTSVRSAVVGAAGQSGDLGGIVSPLLLLVGMHVGSPRTLSFTVMGAASLGAALLASSLPETVGLPQTETMAELQERIRNHQLQRRRPPHHGDGPRRKLHKGAATSCAENAASTSRLAPMRGLGSGAARVGPVA